MDPNINKIFFHVNEGNLENPISISNVETAEGSQHTLEKIQRLIQQEGVTNLQKERLQLAAKVIYSRYSVKHEKDTYRVYRLAEKIKDYIPYTSSSQPTSMKECFDTIMNTEFDLDLEIIFDQDNEHFLENLRFICDFTDKDHIRITSRGEQNIPINNLRALLDYVSNLVPVPPANEILDLCANPQFYACQKGDLNLLERLLELNVDLYAQDQIGQTPLHIAIENGHRDIAMRLIDQGADVTLTDNNNQTPLHIATMNGHKDVAMHLIDQGASIRVADANNKTPLEYVDSKFLDEYFVHHSDFGFLREAAQERNLNVVRYCMNNFEKLLNHSNNREGANPFEIAFLYRSKELLENFTVQYLGLLAEEAQKVQTQLGHNPDEESLDTRDLDHLSDLKTNLERNFPRAAEFMTGELRNSRQYQDLRSSIENLRSTLGRDNEIKFW